MPLSLLSLRRRALPVCLLLAGLVLPAQPAPASAVARQPYPVPPGRVYTVHGHGFGHGHGMSQYGAYGAARRGLKAPRILRFYYPGTVLAPVRAGMAGRVRVLVSADTTRDLVVSPAAGLVLHDLGSGAAYRLPVLPGVTRWRLNVAAGRSVVGYYDSGWHRYRPGGRAALVGDGQLGADEPLTLWTPSGSRSYRGGLRAASPSPGSSDRDTVNVVTLDDYVRGVLPAEMPPSWSAQALRAQAVAARTYAAWSRSEVPRRYYHLCDTSSCQVYRGAEAEDARSDAAVASTARRVLTHDGSPAFTQFSASSGGWTAAGSRPYLVARADPFDAHDANPVHDWTQRLGAALIERAYPSLGRLRRLVVTRRDGHGQWGGRVERIVLDGQRADVALSGDAFRSAFGLRSSWFAA
jgi:stage II sporulation protein D